MSEDHWLRRPVVVGLSALLVVLYLLAWTQRTLGLWRSGWVDANGMPFGGDFITFWAAARLGWEGRATEAFDPEVFFAVQDGAIAGNAAHFLWNYPPPFHLVVMPFGATDLVTATWIWWALTIPLFLGALTAVVPRWETPVLGLAGSAVLLNLAHGQNGFLLTGILVVGLWLVLQGRSVLGGIVLGCLAIKPHFGVLLPVLFVALRDPRAFIATGISTLAWCLVSTGAFGVAYWEAFFANLSIVGAAIDTGELPPTKLVTPYVLGRTLGLGGAAWGVQGLASLGAVGCVAWAAVRGRPAAAMAVLLVGTTLFSPYLFDYDLILLSGAFAFAYVDRSERGWVVGERELWGLAALLPVAIAPLWGLTGVQLGPLLTVPLLAACTAAAVRGNREI